MPVTYEPKPKHGTEAWLEARRRNSEGQHRFGASEAPTLMGCDDYRNLVDLFLSKQGKSEQVSNAATHRGNVLEPALVAEASRILRTELVVPEVMFVKGRLLANLDAADDPYDPTVIVECKTTTKYSIDDQIPDPYYWQAITQLAVTDALKCIVICLDKYQHIGTWTVQRDAGSIDLLTEVAYTVGEAFDQGEIPQVQPNEAQIRLLYPNPVGAKDLTDEEEDVFTRWHKAKMEREEAEAQEKVLRDQIANIFSDTEAVTWNGTQIATFKSRRIGERLDAKSLEADHPELVAAYRKDGGTTRVLRWTRK